MERMIGYVNPEEELFHNRDQCPHTDLELYSGDLELIIKEGYVACECVPIKMLGRANEILKKEKGRKINNGRYNS